MKKYLNLVNTFIKIKISNLYYETWVIYLFICLFYCSFFEPIFCSYVWDILITPTLYLVPLFHFLRRDVCKLGETSQPLWSALFPMFVFSLHFYHHWPDCGFSLLKKTAQVEQLFLGNLFEILFHSEVSLMNTTLLSGAIVQIGQITQVDLTFWQCRYFQVPVWLHASSFDVLFCVYFQRVLGFLDLCVFWVFIVWEIQTCSSIKLSGCECVCFSWGLRGVPIYARVSTQNDKSRVWIRNRVCCCLPFRCYLMICLILPSFLVAWNTTSFCPGRYGLHCSG